MKIEAEIFTKSIDYKMTLKQNNVFKKTELLKIIENHDYKLFIYLNLLSSVLNCFYNQVNFFLNYLSTNNFISFKDYKQTYFCQI